MNAAPSFVLVSTSPETLTSLYEAPRDSDGAWSAYLLVTPTSPVPEAISFGDAMLAVQQGGVFAAQYAGNFLFGSTRPAALDIDPNTFIDQIVAYLGQQAVNQPCILWLQEVNPLTFGAPISAFGMGILCSSFSGAFTTIAISPNGGSQNFNARLGNNFLFNILAGTAIKTDGDNALLRFSSPNVQSPGIAFQRGQSNLGLTVTGENNYIFAFLPFTGSSTGCCTFTAQIESGKAFGSGGLPLGFQYSASDSGSGQLVSFSYPAFSLVDLPAKMTCIGTVDPLDPFNQRIPQTALIRGVLRTGFTITAGQGLPSCFRNSQGNQISLLPQLAAAPSFPPPVVLQAGAFALTTSEPIPSSTVSAVPGLTLCGQFAVSAAQLAVGQTLNLLCGIFGSEFISLTSYDPQASHNDLLQFYLAAYQADAGDEEGANVAAAYAPAFPFVSANLNAPDSGSVVSTLSLQRSSAWLSIVNGSGTPSGYHAEPAGSAMFGFPNGSATAATDVGYTVLQSAPPTLPVAQGYFYAFPMVPYAGVATGSNTADSIASFESSILAATRKHIISRGAASTWTTRASVRQRAYRARLERQAVSSLIDRTDVTEDDVAPHYRTTPSGMIAIVDPDNDTYLCVTLGQTVSSIYGTLPFSFDLPDKQLQDALQTNQLFLVIVNPENISTSPSSFENLVDIAGWSMRAKIGSGVSATAYRNVMILKYCSGSFKDRIANPNAWSSQASFSLPRGTDESAASVSYTGLSTWLQNLVADAELQVAQNASSPYANFVELVNDPDWTGVLVLQADLDPSSLPAGLAGIVAGIDLSRFVAHHFGFTASRVSVNPDGTITFNGNSSTFGLVDYINPTYAANLAMGLSPNTPIALSVPDNYAFSVLQLQVLFDNAAIKTFKSYIELGVELLFNTGVALTTFNGERMPTNGVVLDGSYIDQNGSGIYIFEQALPTVFALDSNVLTAVSFTRTQFNCMGNIDDGATVLNRFLVWGSFEFAALKDASGNALDILSFGALADTETDASPSGVGLAFSSLLIDMTYPQTTPNAVSFAEDTANLSYDLSASVFRQDSLFRGFGLQLNGFVAAKAGQRPADFGFLTVGVPISLASIDGPWYGVTYNVTMGGPGALASAAGFNSTLLLAWAPTTNTDDEAYALFIGLSLPGAAPGAKLISLQGVFKVSVDSIALSRQKVPTDTSLEQSLPDAYYYCLRLDNIGIKILGITKLPPNATIQFFLFGDPASTNSLGWYAAYRAEDETAAAAALSPHEVPTLAAPSVTAISARPAPITTPIA